MLTCVLLVTADFDSSSSHLGQILRLQSWSDRGSTRNEIRLDNRQITILDVISVEQILDRDCRLQVGLLVGEARLSRKLVQTYQEKGFNRVIIAAIDLRVSIGMYHIFLNGRRESEFVREIIREMSGPFDGLLDPDRATKTTSGDDIELFHPVQVANRDYLNVAHVTDTHLALRWELMKHKLRDNQQLLDRFNNPNDRFRESFDLINEDSDVHLTLLTGDIIDYNRGHSGNMDSNDIDRDYLFNRNWLLFYEALMDKYEKPIFTMPGNHDWRLNPYAPTPEFGWDNFPLALLCALPLLISGAGVGALEGLAFGLFNKKNKDVWDIPIGILALMYALAWSPFIFVMFILILESATNTVRQTTMWKYSMWAGVIFGSLLSIILLVMWGFDRESFGEGAGEGTAKGIEVGTIYGGILEGLLLIVAAILVFARYVKMRQVNHIVNLTEADTKEVIPQDFNDLDVLGNDGIFVNAEDALFWYFLVINPFHDYSLRYKDMSFLMLDFNEGEDLVNSKPPNPANSLSTQQWQRIQAWLAGMTTTTVPILAMHATVFSPHRKEIEVDELVTRGRNYVDVDLNEGAIYWHRGHLIELIKRLELRQVYPIVLTGHTHVNDIFQLEENNLLRKKLSDPATSNRFDPSKALFITTVCNGPIGDLDEAGTRNVTPGFRVIKFDSQGKVSSLDVIRLPEAERLMRARTY